MSAEIQECVEKAKAFHGDACFGLVLGTRLGLAAMKELGLEPMKRARGLITFVEVDRCMADAIQVVTGCTLGHRNLKYVDYGKFAAVLWDTTSCRAVRVSPKELPFMEDSKVLEYLQNAPEEELARLEDVEVHLDENDLPGKPKGRVACSKCGERIFDNRGVAVGNRLLCRPCANGAYYRVVKGGAVKP